MAGSRISFRSSVTHLFTEIFLQSCPSLSGVWATLGHGQLIKALLVTLVQGLGLYFLGTSGIPALKKFGTLGTVQMEMQFNPLP